MRFSSALHWRFILSTLTSSLTMASCARRRWRPSPIFVGNARSQCGHGNCGACGEPGTGTAGVGRRRALAGGRLEGPGEGSGEGGDGTTGPAARGCRRRLYVSRFLEVPVVNRREGLMRVIVTPAVYPRLLEFLH